jgi:hypothetical protein
MSEEEYNHIILDEENEEDQEVLLQGLIRITFLSTLKSKATLHNS